MDELYYGVPLDVFKSVFEAQNNVRARQARFWAFSAWPMVWIVVYPDAGCPPFPVLVDGRLVSISRCPSDPPPMPVWAREGEVVHGA